ncbi:S8 family serine peptidase [Kitasatospora sp. NPDC058218]|uniref:cyanobactin maturation protease PatG family protein n=1 Tax=Kitasatospora sp. NPDC058218 TaxID=3346385 RepID=UPI0036DEE8E7
MEARSVLQALHPPHDSLLGDDSVCVAVLDGPVDLTHPCFAGADLTRLDTLVGQPAGPGPMSQHGTHVASLLFGQPDSPVAGLVPRCRGLLLPVFRDGAQGRVPQLDLARAVERAVQEGAHIINISGGEPSQNVQVDAMLERALRLCEDSGVLVVAAVGNDGCDCLQVPAAVPSVLAVGAAGPDGEPLAISNWGAAYAANGVLAPGRDIEGAVPGGARRALTGSSFATPLVSGVAALLVAAQLRAGHDAEPRAAGRAVLRGAAAPDCSPSEAPQCRRRLAGRLDAARAYELITRRDDPTTAVADQASAAGLPVPALVPLPAGPSTALPVPAQPTTRRVRALSPEPGVDAASSLRTCQLESHEGASIMDTESAPVVTAQEGVATTGVEPGGVVHRPPEDQTTVAGSSLDRGVAPSAPCQCQGGGQQPAEYEAAMASVREPWTPPEPPTVAAPAQSAPTAGGQVRGVRPSCDSAESGRHPLVYAIGQIGTDFLTEARRDSFRQEMDPVPGDPVGGRETETPANPYDPKQLYDYLARNPWASNKLTWTLTMDSTPIYALEGENATGMDWSTQVFDPDLTMDQLEQLVGRPNELVQVLLKLSTPPVSTVYRSFRDAIVGQARPENDPGFISRVSVPGRLTGRTVRLFSGQVVPVVEVKSRGIYTWSESDLVNSVLQAVKKDTDKRNAQAFDEAQLRKTVRALLDKIYYQFRNLGQSSADRALNYAGTNAFLFASQISEGLLSAKHVPGKDDHLYALDYIRVSKSPYCRLGSDCQDVAVGFFDPEDERRSRVTYLFTIDVSDELPVTLAPVHQFIGDM